MAACFSHLASGALAEVARNIAEYEGAGVTCQQVPIEDDMAPLEELRDIIRKGPRVLTTPQACKAHTKREEGCEGPSSPIIRLFQCPRAATSAPDAPTGNR